jgi:hypothetical protein
VNREPVKHRHPLDGGALRAIRRARRVGWSCLALFHVAFLAAPCLHLFDHHADHHHEGDGRQSAGSPHSRAWRWLVDETHDHRHPHAHPQVVDGAGPWNGSAGFPRADIPAEAAPVPEGLPDPAHGHGALAHFGLGILPAAVFVILPPAIEVDAIDLVNANVAPRSLLAVGLPDARGPPALS